MWGRSHARGVCERARETTIENRNTFFVSFDSRKYWERIFHLLINGNNFFFFIRNYSENAEIAIFSFGTLATETDIFLLSRHSRHDYTFRAFFTLSFSLFSGKYCSIELFWHFNLAENEFTTLLFFAIDAIRYRRAAFCFFFIECSSSNHVNALNLCFLTPAQEIKFFLLRIITIQSMHIEEMTHFHLNCVEKPKIPRNPQTETINY